ncbi:MAG TPA: hypothetical protein VNI83_09345 [Vicinamibacterales bacterium]|nr:hypothetical protein [Vicinamibacterales bacterium]
MTAVRAPFVFTSDRWHPEFIEKARLARCGAIALQLGVAPADAARQARAAGLQVIGWGSCSPATRDQLAAMRPDVWMPQAETTDEFEALVAALPAAPLGLPCEPVMTSGGMEHPAPRDDTEKVREVQRRRSLLRSYGVNRVWVEVYAQDADRSAQPWLGDVDRMVWQFQGPYDFDEARPVVGLWNTATRDYPLSRYDLSRHGRMFGAWRAEQMADARYAEIAAWVAQFDTDVPANRQAALDKLAASVRYWRGTGMQEATVDVQRQTLAWRVLHVTQSGENVRALRDLLDRMGAPRP